MYAKVASIFVLAVLACISTGCETNPSAQGDGESYRTLRVEPRRNTDEAKRENQAGLDHMAQGDLQKAYDAFGRALAADVDYGPAHNNLGKIYFKQKDWYKAAWEFEYARKLMLKHAEPRNNLGLVLEEAGELDKAVDQYKEAVNLDGNVEYRANLVRAMIRRGERTEEVRSLLQQVIDEDTRPTWAIWAKQQLANMPDNR